MSVRLIVGDALTVCRTLQEQSIHVCVTSPPYYRQRDYGVVGQIGLENTPGAYVDRLVAAFREVRRVLREDGTLWIVIGDSAARSGGHNNGSGGIGSRRAHRGRSGLLGRTPSEGSKPKDILLIPARLALALQADGWYLRSEIIWHKPDAVPESVSDRPSNVHEKVYLLAKSERYFYDARAIMELSVDGRTERNRRNIWTVPASGGSAVGDHCATFPPDLIKLCIQAGSRPGGLVLDPFAGLGTTGLVADRLRRHAILIELNATFVKEAASRLRKDNPLYGEVITGEESQRYRLRRSPSLALTGESS